MGKPPLTHIAFNCDDITAMAEFYREFAGLEIGHDRVDDGMRVAWLGVTGEPAPFMIVLLERPGNQPDGPHAMEHLGFEVDTDAEVDAVIEKARRSGVPVVEGPMKLPPPVGYFVILADPAGNRVEFSCPKEA